MISATVEVKVFLEPDAGQPSGYRFVNLKIGDEPTIPIQQDKPVPRRFVQVLVEAAKLSLDGPAKADGSLTGVTPVTSSTREPTVNMANPESMGGMPGVAPPPNKRPATDKDR